MKITKEWLKKNNACMGVIKWFLSQAETNGIAIIRAMASNGKFDWAIWTITHMLNRKQNIQFAIFAAEQVLDLHEKKHPNDKRPRIVIETARAVLKNDNKKTRAAARAAVDVALAPTRVTTMATTRAAASAVAASVRDDDWTAREAWSTAWVSRDGGDAMKIKIIEYGISLLEGA